MINLEKPHYVIVFREEPNGQIVMRSWRSEGVISRRNPCFVDEGTPAFILPVDRPTNKPHDFLDCWVRYLPCDGGSQR